MASRLANICAKSEHQSQIDSPKSDPLNGETERLVGRKRIDFSFDAFLLSVFIPFFIILICNFSKKYLFVLSVPSSISMCCIGISGFTVYIVKV